MIRPGSGNAVKAKELGYAKDSLQNVAECPEFQLLIAALSSTTAPAEEAGEASEALPSQTPAAVQETFPEAARFPSFPRPPQGPVPRPPQGPVPRPPQ